MKTKFKLKNEPEPYKGVTIIHKISIRTAYKHSSERQQRKSIAKELGIESDQIIITD